MPAFPKKSYHGDRGLPGAGILPPDQTKRPAGEVFKGVIEKGDR